ncbi:MAG: hypothetical protein IRZ05_21625 [Micromonosporaceae bacterium]|nr:hypothetical protein [Micromonosporaceae bacterium]
MFPRLVSAFMWWRTAFSRARALPPTLATTPPATLPFGPCPPVPLVTPPYDREPAPARSAR